MLRPDDSKLPCKQLLLLIFGGDLCRRQRPEPPIWEYKVVFQFKLSITLLSWPSVFWLQRIRNTYLLCRLVGRGRTKIPCQISLIRRQYISVVEMATCSVMIWNSFEREYFCFSDFTWHSTISDSILFPHYSYYYPCCFDYHFKIHSLLSIKAQTFLSVVSFLPFFVCILKFILFWIFFGTITPQKSHK